MVRRHSLTSETNPKSEYVGVGIMVTHNPLLRSGHAALLHPAPALGNDAKAFPGIRVTDANLRKPSGNMALHPSPRQVSSLTTPFKHAPPDPTHCQSKVTDRYPIHGHSVVPHVASHHRAQVPTHLWNGLVHALPKFFFDLLQLRLPSPAHRLPQHHKLSLARLTPAMGEPKKVKGVRLSLPSLAPLLLRISAKLNQARLLRMKFQSKSAQPLPKLAQKPLPIFLSLQSHNEVVCKPHHDHIPVRFASPPLFNPQIEHIGQIDVGHQRTDTSTLNRPYLTSHSLAILQHSGAEPLLDQPHHAPIRYTMLDKLHQPSMLEGVKESTDVTIEHPVHFSPHDPNRKRIQRLMRTLLRSKTIGEPSKVLLIKRTQYLRRGVLDNLIFQHRHAERSKLARLANLGNVRSAHRPGPIRSSLDPIGEIFKITLQVLSVVPPRLTVDPCGSLAPEREVCCTPSLNVINVVQERREPLSFIPPCCLTYPLKRAGHVLPALCPEHVTLKQIPLGQPPSLHHLLGLRLGLVRRLCRYYGAVRLPMPVHHRRASLDFPMRSGVFSSPDRHRISRFPLTVLAYMHRVSDRAESKSVSPYRRLQFCLPLISTASAPRSSHRFHGGVSISRLNPWPIRTPVNASPAPLRTPMHDSEPVRIANPSPYETFIHNTLPVFTGAPKLETNRKAQIRITNSKIRNEIVWNF